MLLESLGIGGPVEKKKLWIYPHIALKWQPKNLRSGEKNPEHRLLLQVNMTKQIGDDKHTRWIPGEDGRIINDAAPSVLFESCQSCDSLNRAVYAVRRVAPFEGWSASERKRFGGETREGSEPSPPSASERNAVYTSHLTSEVGPECIVSRRRK